MNDERSMNKELKRPVQPITDFTCTNAYGENGEEISEIIGDNHHVNDEEEDEENNGDLRYIDLRDMMLAPPFYPHIESSCEADRMQYMEEQQEMLNSCLIALTTHFAQVQLRLRQIVDAPPGEKEALLKDLEEFAFRGIPEVHCDLSKNLMLNSMMEDREEKMNIQRNKQKELIEQLKSQLEDLEKYAYETGEAGLPQNLVIERQKIVLDQLKGKLNLNIEHIDKLTVDDLRAHVDNAIGQLVNPMKMKDQLVTQLKTQISDLERFIDFLQGTSTQSYASDVKECACKCSVHDENHRILKKNSAKCESGGRDSKERRGEEITAKTISIMKRVAALLQIFVGSQFDCDEKNRFSRNSLKKTMKINHWGDLRAQLELAVAEVMELAQEPDTPIDSDYMSDSESVTTVQCNGKLASSVRKHLAFCIQNLMEHGLMPIGQSSSLVPFIACFPPRQQSSKNEMHAWELVLRFYEMKNGEQFNSTPARKLSQSFNLDILGSSAVSYKQSLLAVVGNIITSHSQYKRSYDSHFKAFVCAGLNCKMLVPWLRLIFRCQPLLEMYYQSWSYVAKTGFEDSFVSLEKLNQFHFDLPVDLAIRQLQNIKDAF